MELLFDNPLATMYGPYFLAFYAAVILLTIAAVVLFKRSLDKSGKMPAAAIPSNVDPFEIAYLRGGENEMARAVIFALVRRGQLEVSGSAGIHMIRRVENPEPANLSHAERTALGWVGSLREPKELFAADGLIALLRPLSETYRRRLESQNFLVPEDQLSTMRLVRIGAVLLVAALGIYKFVAAVVDSNSNLLLLPILLIAGVFFVFKSSRLKRLTRHGTEYLERLEVVFEGFRRVTAAENSRVEGTTPAMAGIDPVLLSVGVFGSAVLIGSSYDHYNQAFQRANAASSSGGCGTGCGSCSSSCGSDSGGDSGGSSCSSGCGGCGGGD